MDLLKELNPAQADAVKTTSGPLLILAGAGSGKTKTLTHRIAYLIAHGGIWPNEILAVTFTTRNARASRALALAKRQRTYIHAMDGYISWHLCATVARGR